MNRNSIYISGIAAACIISSMAYGLEIANINRAKAVGNMSRESIVSQFGVRLSEAGSYAKNQLKLDERALSSFTNGKKSGIDAFTDGIGYIIGFPGRKGYNTGNIHHYNKVVDKAIKNMTHKKDRYLAAKGKNPAVDFALFVEDRVLHTMDADDDIVTIATAGLFKVRLDNKDMFSACTGNTYYNPSLHKCVEIPAADNTCEGGFVGDPFNDTINCDNKNLNNLALGWLNLRSTKSDLILSNNPLRDIDELRNLSEVDGDLKFCNDANLTNLDGLMSLQKVGGSIKMCNLKATESYPFQNLTYVGGLYFPGSNFVDLSGLVNLTEIGPGGLVLSNMPKFRSFGRYGLPALPNIKKIKGPIVIENAPNVEELDLRFLSNLETNIPQITLRNMPHLTKVILPDVNIEKFVVEKTPALQHIALNPNIFIAKWFFIDILSIPKIDTDKAPNIGRVTIENVENVGNILDIVQDTTVEINAEDPYAEGAFCSNLDSNPSYLNDKGIKLIINGKVANADDALEMCAPDPNFTCEGGFGGDPYVNTIPCDNKGLTKLVHDWAALYSVNGDLLLNDNSLTAINSLRNLTRSHGVDVSNNPIDSVYGLRHLQTVEGVLKLDNISATDVVLPELQYASKISIKNNANLTKVSFPKLESVKVIELQGNSKLQDIAGLNNVSNLVQHLAISANPYPPLSQKITNVNICLDNKILKYDGSNAIGYLNDERERESVCAINTCKNGFPVANYNGDITCDSYNISGEYNVPYPGQVNGNIYLNNNSITKLGDGFANLHAAKSLDISNNNISDISNLKNLTGIAEFVSIFNNQITDITPLKSLKHGKVIFDLRPYDKRLLRSDNAYICDTYQNKFYDPETNQIVSENTKNRAYICAYNNCKDGFSGSYNSTIDCYDAGLTGDLANGWSNLNAVDGDLILSQNSDLNAIVLPSLSAVNGNIYLDNENVTKIDLPSLTHIRGRISAIDSKFKQLEEVNIKSLKNVNGDFSISGVQNLTKVNIPGFIVSTGKIFIQNNPNLADLNITDIYPIHSYPLENPDKVVEISNNPKLVEITGLTFYADNWRAYLHIHDNAELKKIDFSAYNGHQVIYNNDNLQELTYRIKQFDGGVILYNNPKLTNESIKIICENSRRCGGFTIHDMPQLTSLDGIFNGTNYYYWEINIGKNMDGLEDISELGKISRISYKVRMPYRQYKDRISHDSYLCTSGSGVIFLSKKDSNGDITYVQIDDKNKNLVCDMNSCQDGYVGTQSSPYPTGINCSGFDFGGVLATGWNKLEYVKYTPSATVDLSSAELSDINSLNNLTKVHTLILDGNKLTDVTLSSLSSIENLYLREMSTLTKISGLENLKNMQYMFLKNSAVEDITGINNFNYIRYIDFNSNIKHISGLNGNTDGARFEYLNLAGKSIQDISGMNNVTYINAVSLQNSSIQNISGLNKLGSVRIFRAYSDPNLVSLSGLTSLSSVSKELRLDHNDNLESLNGLQSLTYVKSMNIGDNPSLSDISALSSLKVIDSDMFIKNVPALKDINPLGESLQTAKNIFISNAGITNITSFNGANINGIGVFDSPNLTSVTGFNGDSTIYEVSLVRDNSLQVIDGFSALNELHIFKFEDDPNLTKVHFPNLKSFALDIQHSRIVNTGLDGSINSFKLDQDNVKIGVRPNGDHYPKYNSNLYITDNKKMTSLDFMSQFSEFKTNTPNSGIYIYNNPALTDIGGLGNLNVDRGTIFLENKQYDVKMGRHSWICNNYLPNHTLHVQFIDVDADGNVVSTTAVTDKNKHIICEFNNCQEGFEGWDHSIECADAGLSSLANGYTETNHVQGNLNLNNNNNLSDISNLSNLTYISGSLNLSGTALKDLHGLESLTKIGGRLILKDMQSLTSLNGLNALTEVTGGITIINAPNLTDTSALSNLKTTKMVFIGANVSSDLDLSGFNGVTNIEHIFVPLKNFNNKMNHSSYICSNDAIYFTIKEYQSNENLDKTILNYQPYVANNYRKLVDDNVRHLVCNLNSCVQGFEEHYEKDIKCDGNSWKDWGDGNADVYNMTSLTENWSHLNSTRLWLQNMPNLTSITSITNANAVDLYINNLGVTELDMSTNAYRVVNISNNSNLTSINMSLPNAVEIVKIDNNQNLTDLRLNGVSYISYLQIRNNQSLINQSAPDFDHVFTFLVENTPNVNIFHNVTKLGGLMYAIMNRSGGRHGDTFRSYEGLAKGIKPDGSDLTILIENRNPETFAKEHIERGFSSVLLGNEKDSTKLTLSGSFFEGFIFHEYGRIPDKKKYYDDVFQIGLIRNVQDISGLNNAKVGVFYSIKSIDDSNSPQEYYNGYETIKIDGAIDTKLNGSSWICKTLQAGHPVLSSYGKNHHVYTNVHRFAIFEHNRNSTTYGYRQFYTVGYNLDENGNAKYIMNVNDVCN